MTHCIDIEEARRRPRQLEHKRSPSSYEYLDVPGDCDDSRSRLDNAQVKSHVFDAVLRSPVRKHECSGHRSFKRLPPTTNSDAELLPFPVMTSSSRTAVTCQCRASSSSIGVGRLLPRVWLPWLLTMMSFCSAAALPVDSGASRGPVKVFDGSVKNADVD